MRRRGLAVVDILLKVIPPNVISRLSLFWSTCWLSFLLCFFGDTKQDLWQTPNSLSRSLRPSSIYLGCAFCPHCSSPQANLFTTLDWIPRLLPLAAALLYSASLYIRQVWNSVSFFRLLSARIRAETLLLVCFMPTWPKLVIWGGGATLNWENASMSIACKQVCRSFSELMIGVGRPTQFSWGQCYPWADSPGWHKRVPEQAKGAIL